MSDYNPESIKILDNRDAVRTRPGMYIGGTAKAGYHHLVSEIVDNAIDEIIGGHASVVEVTLHNNKKTLTVSDDGRGIPPEIHPDRGVSTVEVVFTVLHAGGKFGGTTYGASGGLHGVGASVVNFLSSHLEVSVRRDGTVHMQEFSTGKPLYALKPTGTCRKGDTGTTVTFTPDYDIFGDQSFDPELIKDRLELKSYLNPKSRIVWKDGNTEEVFQHDGGVTEYLTHLIQKSGVGPTHPTPISIEDESEGVRVDIALQWSDDTREDTRSFVNTIPTRSGGTHENGFRAGLIKAVRTYMEINNIAPKSMEVTPDDIKEGLRAIVSIFFAGDMEIEGQTKERLNNAAIQPVVANVVRRHVEKYLLNNSSTAEIICHRILQAARARVASRSAALQVRRKKAVGNKLMLPGKLADCTSNDPTLCELFLVEGDSAGGCFSPETEVMLADGRSLSFLKLLEEQRSGIQNYCYTITLDGSVGLEKITNVRKTKSSAEVVKVVLDNSEEICCTPCHLFMLRDGTYKRADNLTPEDSLMPLNLRKSSSATKETMYGYEMVFDPSINTWKYVHHLADRYNRKATLYDESSGNHRHHKDFNKLNNNPPNITRMPAEDHMQLHRDNLDMSFHAPWSKELATAAKRTPEFRQHMSAKIREQSAGVSARSKQMWEDATYKDSMMKAWRYFYDSNEAYRHQNALQLDENQREYWSSEKNRIEQSERVLQHFQDNPERRDEMSKMAQKQWKDPDLLKWRAEETALQWTDEFRAKRKATLHKTYYTKTVLGLYQFKTTDGVDVEAYRDWRVTNNTKSLKFDTFVSRYFEGDVEKAIEAVLNYNHRVVSVIKCLDQTDVYDLEVQGTHNFALKSGVFVHNSAKLGRERAVQAILPLRGKVLNTESASNQAISGNKEIGDIIEALGCGIGSKFNIQKLRYHKIILLMDADSDGHHITTLLLTFFYRYMPELIHRGHLFIAQPPLFKITCGGDSYWAGDDAERDKILKKLGKKKTDVSRFKGLGEMMKDTLKETTLDPKTRKLLTVEAPIHLYDETDTTIKALMGKGSQDRYEFIMEHLDEVDDLDL